MALVAALPSRQHPHLRRLARVRSRRAPSSQPILCQPRAILVRRRPRAALVRRRPRAVVALARRARRHRHRPSRRRVRRRDALSRRRRRRRRESASSRRDVNEFGAKTSRMGKQSATDVRRDMSMNLARKRRVWANSSRPIFDARRAIRARVDAAALVDAADDDGGAVPRRRARAANDRARARDRDVDDRARVVEERRRRDLG